MRILLGLLSLLLLSCSTTGTGTGTVGPAPTPAPIPGPGHEQVNYGEYPRARTEVSFSTLRRVLGSDSSLSKREQQSFWEEVRGKRVVWTCHVVDKGEAKESGRNIRAKSGGGPESWDTLIFFEPQFNARLGELEQGAAVTFNGALRSYQVDGDLFRVTISSGRLW